MGGAVLACLLPLPQDLMSLHIAVESFERILLSRVPHVIHTHIMSYTTLIPDALRVLYDVVGTYYRRVSAFGSGDIGEF